MKTNFSHSLWLILALLLTACAPLAPTPTITPSATSVPSSTPTLPPTETSTPTPAPQQPPACTFPLAQTTMEEAKPEEYTFSEPRIVLTNPKGDIEIVDWLPDSKQALIVQAITGSQDIHYQTIELFDPFNDHIQMYGKRNGASYPPIWVAVLNAVIYPERKTVSFSRDENGILIQNSIVLNQRLWVSHGNPEIIENLEDVQFKPSDAPHEWVTNSLIVKPDSSQILYLESNGGPSYRLYSRMVSKTLSETPKTLILEWNPGNETASINSPRNMVWRPATSQVFFYSSRSFTDQTYLLDIDTRLVCTLSFDGWVYFARWSPNGRYLAVVTTQSPNGPIWVNYDLKVLDTLTGDLHKIDSNKIDPPDWAHVVSDLSWAPDNHHLAILGIGYVASTSPPPSIDRLYLVDFLSGEVDNLFPSYQLHAGSHGTGLAWSPDGSKIILRCPTENAGRLCLISVQRTTPP